LACVEWDASSALDLPHHIAVELKFLTLLCAKEQEFEMRGASGLLTRCREIQRDFLAAHVVSWSARFAERFMERTEHPWIRALGNMLTVFPQRDLESLESTLGRSEGHKVPSYAALPEPGLPAVESATT
jgi:TorA maturation chaperone TorD